MDIRTDNESEVCREPEHWSAAVWFDAVCSVGQQERDVFVQLTSIVQEHAGMRNRNIIYLVRSAPGIWLNTEDRLHLRESVTW